MFPFNRWIGNSISMQSLALRIGSTHPRGSLRGLVSTKLVNGPHLAPMLTMMSTPNAAHVPIGGGHGDGHWGGETTTAYREASSDAPWQWEEGGHWEEDPQSQLTGYEPGSWPS